MGAKSKWTKEETDYLVKNYKNMTYGEMSKYIDKSVKQISSKVYLLGLSKRKDDWWTDEDIKYLVENYKTSTYVEIGKEIDKTKSAVQTKIRKMGLVKNNQDMTKKKIDEDYFKIIDNEEKAYWLGFIAADGCISHYKSGEYRFSFVLQYADNKTLEKFIKCIEGNFNPVESTSTWNNKIYKTSKVSFKNKKFVINLLQYFPYNKTDNLRISDKIQPKYMRHFLRGFSDGDGSFYCGNRSNRKSFEIISNSPNMLKDVQKEFNKNNINSNIYIKQNGNYKLGIYNFKDLTMLHSYFYDDATIFMERKYLKSQNILKLPSK